MIDRIITDYLGQHKRLVVPGFGAFIRKDEDGTVVFVEFLRKDDNVLLPMLAAELGVGHAAAQEALDGYVSGMKRRIEQAGSYVIDGLGVMRRTENGAYDLAYDPKAHAVPADEEPVPDDAKDTGAPVEVPDQAPDGGETAFGMETTVFEAIESIFGTENPDETLPIELMEGDRAVADLSSPTDSEEGTVVVFDESGVGKEPPASPGKSENIAPEPAVERPAGASHEPSRRVVSPPEPTQKHPVSPPEPAQKRPVPAPGGRAGRKKSKMDWIIIIAVLAAILAIIAMVFYATTGSNPHLDIWNGTADPIIDSLP